jgi:N,N'-diacetyllegionaminate synthase
MKPHLTLKTGRRIGPGEPVYIIAEIGSNHDGSLEKAKRLIQAAHQAGADAAKFQSFQAHTLINRHRKANGAWEDHPAWETLQQLSLPDTWHAELNDYCKQIGIDFLSAPFNEASLALLDRLEVPAIKIASGDLTHHRFLNTVGQLKRPVILSTGLAYLGEVETALRILNDAGCDEVALLHCVSLYPPRFEDSNIRAMVTLQKAFQVPVGYSDHTPGNTVPLGAVALGASVIEKHLTDDKTAPGPDHSYALDIPEFTQMVTQIRNLEMALGDGIKKPAPGEIGERVGARRGIYACQVVSEGTVLTADMLKVVRHAYEEGIPAPLFEKIIGKTVTQTIQPHELLTWEMISG